MENTTYQQEIARLNYFITLLIKENEELKQQLQQEQAENQQNKVISSHPLAEDRQNNPVLPNPASEDVQDKLVLPNPLLKDVQNKVISSYPLPEDGQNKLISSNPSGGMPQNNIVLPAVPEETALNKLNAPGAALPAQVKQYSLQDIQQMITENKINAVNVFKKMRQERVSAPKISLHNSLKILKHLAFTPENTIAELSKATGMSESGISKQFAMLKRKGYIVRAKFKNYMLTEKALQLLGGSL